MANCILPSMLSNYSSGLIHFTKFCDDFQVPEADCMPASETLLSMFISTYATGSVSKGTMGTWVKGLYLWHIINDSPWHGDSILNCTLKVCPNTMCWWILTSYTGCCQIFPPILLQDKERPSYHWTPQSTTSLPWSHECLWYCSLCNCLPSGAVAG